LAHGLRKEVERKGERLPTGWTEDSVSDLRAGRLTGWYLSEESEPSGLAFYSRRGGRAFGHVHVEGGAAAGERAYALLYRIATDPERGPGPMHIGVTGLSE